MLSKALFKILDSALQESGTLEKLEELLIQSLGTPPDIDKEKNLRNLPKLPDIDTIEKIIRYHELSQKLNLK